jgi:hypothetical protein
MWHPVFIASGSLVATNNPLGLAFIERRVSNVGFRLRFARQE